MSDKDDLLAAVFASPEDDAPRLVYADFLLENGNERGEFIQLQIALGRPLVGAAGYSIATHKLAKNPPNRAELERREKELARKYQKQWLAPIRSFIRTWHFRRGFVEKVEADGAKFLSGVETVTRAEPVTHAELTGFSPKELDLLRTTEALVALRSLHIGQQRIGPKHAHVLLSPYFSELEALDLWGNPLGPEGTRIFAQSQHLRSLKNLRISHVDMLLEGVKALSEAPFFPALQEIDLGIGYDANGTKAFGPEAAQAIARGESLRVIDLGGCKLGDAGIAVLADAPSLGNLEELQLFGNDITEVGVEALVRSKHLKSLKRVVGLIGYDDGVNKDSNAARLLRERFGEGTY